MGSARGGAVLLLLREARSTLDQSTLLQDHWVRAGVGSGSSAGGVAELEQRRALLVSIFHHHSHPQTMRLPRFRYTPRYACS